MKLRNVKLTKSAKFLTLLLASLLIGVANAAIFYTLTMQPQVTTATPVISLYSAPDTPSGSTVSTAWCSLTAKSYPNATLTYEKALYINNTDATNAHTFQLRHVSITPANGTDTNGNWTSIKFLVYDGSGYQFAMNYTVSSTNWIVDPSAGTGYYSIPANTGWWIRLETLSPADAAAGYTCQMNIAVDINE